MCMCVRKISFLETLSLMSFNFFDFWNSKFSLESNFLIFGNSKFCPTSFFFVVFFSRTVMVGVLRKKFGPASSHKCRQIPTQYFGNEFYQITSWFLREYRVGASLPTPRCLCTCSTVKKIKKLCPKKRFFENLQKVQNGPTPAFLKNQKMI